MDLFKDTIFKNDPLYMKSLIGRSVRVTTVEEVSFTGLVYVIDPIYKTIVLHTKETSPNKHDAVFILHHAIKSLETLSHSVEESYLDQKSPVSDTRTSETQKQLVKKWLQKMYVSIEEVGEYLKIDSDLVILPPYGLDNCISSNTIVLEKIRNLLSLMPKDFV